MPSLFLLAAVSFTVAFLLTPLCRNQALKWGWVDHPDEVRKFHRQPIPRIGGIPIAVAYLVSFAVFLVSPLNARYLLWVSVPLTVRICAAVGIVFATGLLDDLVGLKPWQKLAGQLAAAAVAVAAGVQITGVAGYHIAPWIAVPVTLLWLIGCTNAFNLIDGVDGLAAGVGLFATTTTIVAALLGKNIPLAMATVPLAGALLGFLRYNFNPASVFLGDSGSLLVGFLLGCLGILWSQKATTILGMTAPLMALAIPLLDTALAIVRRFLRKQPIFGADRGHIHHRLLARGLTPRAVALVVYAVCGVAACFSVLVSVLHDQFGGIVILLFCAVAWIGVQNLGYAELGMAGRMVVGGTFRRLLNARLHLGSFRDDLGAAATPDACWDVIRPAYSVFGFNAIKLRFQDRYYIHTTNGNHVPRSWTLRISLSDVDFVELSREFDTKAPLIVAGFADSIAEILSSKYYRPKDLSGIIPRRDKPRARAAAAGAAGNSPFNIPAPPPEMPIQPWGNTL